MADITQGTTVPVSFFTCNFGQSNLFSVQSGVPAAVALDAASDFLDMAVALADQFAGDNDSSIGYAASKLISMAKAVVDSVLNGIESKCDGDRRFNDLLERVHQFSKEGVLVIDPQAGAPAAVDAGHFLSWVEQQVKGGHHGC